MDNASKKPDFYAFQQFFLKLTAVCSCFGPETYDKLLVMNKTILILAFLLVPFTMVAQTTEDTKKETEKNTINTEVAVRKVEPISTNPKVQNKTINFNKSNDLISVKAYIKSLQMKRKETQMS